MKETTSSFPRRLAGLAAGVLAALLIWPGTSWLVRSQAALTVPLPSSRAPWTGVWPVVQGTGVNHSATLNGIALEQAVHRVQETADRTPNDYLIQYGAAMMTPAANGIDSRVRVARLRALTLRFPDKPGLYAGALRYATQGEVLLHRQEVDWTSGYPASRNRVDEPTDPQDLEAYDRDALAGERLDPDNAYFPFMRSIGLFDAHRDQEALDEIKKASRESNWNEYISDDLHGQWKIYEQTFGSVGVIPRIAIAAAILFPHFAELSASSKTAVALAAIDEVSGHVDEGLAIRQAVGRCGALIRAQSSSLIGALVGTKIERLALYRPAGAPAPSTALAPDNGAERAKKLLGDFDSFLQRTGHGDLVAATDTEFAAGEEVKQISTHGFDTVLDNLSRLEFKWLAGVLLLSSALVMIVLWGVGGLIAGHPRMRSREGLPGWARFSSAMGVLGGVAAAAVLISQNAIEASCAGFAIVLVLCVGLLYAPTSKLVPLRKLAAFGAAMAGVGLFVCGPLAHFTASAWPIANLAPCTMVTCNLDGDPPVDSVVMLLVLAVPLLTVLVFGILSLLWKTPLSVGLSRGLQAYGMPIACLLVLGYCALLPFTLRSEGQMEDGLRRASQHEGPYLAEMAGKPWPGATTP